MATFNTVITNVSGSVGIGTTSVTSRLLVLGNSSNLGEQIATFKPNGSQTGGVGVLDVQNSGGSSILFVTGSGFVGVGISTPGVKLDVFAGGNTAARFVSNLANTNPTLAAEPGIILYTQNSTAGNYMSITNRDASYNANAQINLINVNHTGDGAINFVTRTSSTAGERVRITPAGRVGIGLTDPSALLANTNTADGIAAANSSGIQWKSTANDWAAVVIGRPASGNSYGLRAHSGGTTASDIPFAASSGAGTGTIRLLVTGAGNVGIGTLTPLMGLHVAASIGNPVYGGLDGNGNEFLIRGNLYYDLTNSRAQPITTGFQTMIAMNNSVGGIRFYTSPGSVAAGSISTVAERMVIDTSGLVGIGTTSPEGNLDVRINGIGGTVQSAWSSAGMPYSTYGNLTITQRHSTAVGSGAADGFGYAGPFIDLRAANGAAEWSVSQIMGVGDPFGTATYNGGLAFLVSGGGSNDPTGRRNAGDAPQVRMLIGAAKSYISTDVGIGTTNPSSKLHVAGGDIRFNSTYGIIGATNTAGNVLRADGTRFVPAQLSYSDLSTTNMPVRTVSYTSITGASGDWYPLFKFGATDTTGAVVCTLSTASHSSVTFAVNRGWPGSNFYSISVLNCVLNPNGGFPAVTEIRVIADSAGTYDAQVEVKLVWSSGPTTNVTASVMASPMNVVFAASLATTAAGSASPGVSDSVVLSNNMMRAKGNIIAGGNVGIGTSSPAVKLHVGDQTTTAQTTVRIGGGGGDKAPVLSLFNAGSREGYVAQSTTNLYIGNTGGLASYADSTLASNAGITVNTSNSVGIGTTSPGTLLDVYGTSNPRVRVSSGAATAPGFSILQSGQTGWTMYQPGSSSDLRFAQASDYITFQNGGNVGIGTTNPSGVLEVRQTNNAGRTNVTFINPATASTSNRMRLRIAASGGFNGTDLHPYMEAYEENAGNAANGLAFGTYNGSALGERLRIDASGNVGIGKTNPAYPLDVTGTSRYTGIAYYDGGESINLYGIRGRFSGEAMHLYNKVAIGYPSGWGGDISTTPIYGLSTYGGAILAYNQGTVGIGTATSSVRLYVHGSSTATTPTMLVKEGVAAPTNGALAFEVEKSTGATIFAVSGSGFVGVGTSNPAGTFEVVGVSGSLLLVTDNLSGSLFSVNDVTGLPILEVFSDDTLIAGRVNTNALVVTGSIVGVGTRTPSNTLDVNGTVRVRSVSNATGNFATYSGTGVLQQRTAAEVKTDLSLNNVQNLSVSQIFNNTGAVHGTRSDFANITDFGYQYVQGTTNGPNLNSATQYYAWTIGLGSEYSYANYGAQFAIPRAVANPYMGVRYREATTWSSWHKLAAGNADILTTARTLWGQSFDGSGNVTGNLTSVGNITGNSGITLTAAGTLSLVASGANVITATTNGTEALRIDSSQNVGIGTATAGTRLHVYSGATDEVTRFESTGNPYISLYDTGVRQGYLYSNTSSVELVAENSKPLYLQGATEIRLRTNTTTDRVIINSGGVVGIDYTPPITTSVSKLMVASDITLAKANASLLGNLYYDTAVPGWKYAANGYGWGFREDNAGKLQMVRAGNNTSGANAAASISLTDLFTFDLVNNRVGLGTSSPSTKFHVLHSSNDPVLIEQTTDTAWNRIYFKKPTRSWTLGPDNSTGTNNVFVLADETAGSYRVIVDTSGRVGIGTGTMTTTLNLYNSTNNGTTGVELKIPPYTILSDAKYSLKDNTTELGKFYIINGDVGRTSATLLAAVGSTNVLGFETNNTRAMTIDTSQRVGIGTATMTRKLVVQDSDAFINGLTVGQGGGGGTTQTSNTAFGVSALNSNTSGIGYNVGVGYFAGGSITSGVGNVIIGGYNGLSHATQDNNIFLCDGLGSIRAMITGSNGSVGIGTTVWSTTIGSPKVSLLTFSSNTNVQVVSSSAGGAYSYYYGKGTASGGSPADALAVFGLSNSTPPSLELGTVTNHRIDFATNSTAAMSINTSQYVGIGTTGPSTWLHILRPSGEMRIENSDTALATLSFLRLKGGVGSQRSTVLGHKITNVAATNTSFVIESHSSIDALDSTLATYDYSSNFWAFRTANVEAMRISSSGNVGIGTTSMSGKLHVNGQAYVKGFASNVVIGSFETSFNGISLDNGSNYTILGGYTDNNLYINRPTGGDILIREGNGGSHLHIKTGGNVGVGTTNPEVKLEAWGTNAAVYVHNTGNSRGGIRALNTQRVAFMTTAAADDLVFGYETTYPSSVSFTEIMRVDNGTSRVGILTTAPAYTLEVIGSAGKTGGGSWSTSSDQRLKENIVPLTGSLDKLLKIRGVEFDWRVDGRHDVGVIAQEVEKIFPEWVIDVSPNEQQTAFIADKVKSFGVGNDFFAYAVEAFRELKSENVSLKSEIQSLKDQISSILAMLNNK